ncbi:hypothetical protein ASPACDRAFT_78581 [Aspergillus aculeatus ATCC 16872]|uniref:Uncharacterized protein n=1 Tax=Aspergillus aculeatus (strain ATCC 16872 / CBS 172.66 / WB 5094) TaxID=690307 RepID=A0A1L9WTU4_ASPA1|nr:uncharacterized protein ASPACDRAFT_78581 [Aspergillus aculeatus ATCC 16872]OJJ99646.1 hypothetical protein ASPACDRAFT_78581 [Aspergillus aculeatus ATCC 16872]
MLSGLTRFRARMRTANRAFIQSRIAEIETRDPSAPDQKKIQRMAEWRYCDWNPAPDRWDDGKPYLQMVDDDAVPDRRMDGVYPTRLRTETARQIYLDMLQGVFQRQAEARAAREGLEHPGVIPRCEELGRLLRYAHEVQDPDLRQSRVAEFAAGLFIHFGDEDLEGIGEGVEGDEGEDEEGRRRRQEREDRYHECVRTKCEHLRQSLEQPNDYYSSLFGRATIVADVDCDLEVKAGVLTGEEGYQGQWPQWYSAYLYCRKYPDDDDEEEEDEEEGKGDQNEEQKMKWNDDVPDSPNIHEWGWRIVFMEVDYCDPWEPQQLYGRRPRFDSIPEFLDWYSSWPDHLTERQLLSYRRHARGWDGCQTDCESECEDHC